MRRLLLVVLALFVLVTVAAFVFDLATNDEMRPARSLYAGPFVEADGTLLAYRTWGTSGSPVLLLNGAAESGWVWHAVGPRLAAAGHRVYALDLPPFGYSERRGPYTMAHWLELVEAFEAKLGIARPVIVGHSLGAGVAVAEGLKRPSGVAGVVLLDGDALAFGGDRGWLAHLLVYPYFTAAYRLATGSDWLVGKLVRNGWGPHPPPITHATIAEFERPFRVAGTDGAIKEMASGGIPGVTLADLGRLRVPRAVLWGADDSVDSLASGRVSAAALHTPFVTIPGAGHLSMLAQPAATAGRILSFIAGLGRSRSS
jgi:pimeloyl-ACP methyl ester carboxylesterase